MKAVLEQLNSVLPIMTTTIVTVTALIGAVAALLRQVKRLRGGGGK